MQFEAWQLKHYFQYHHDTITLQEFHDCMQTLKKISNNLDKAREEKTEVKKAS